MDPEGQQRKGEQDLASKDGGGGSGSLLEEIKRRLGDVNWRALGEGVEFNWWILLRQELHTGLAY